MLNSYGTHFKFDVILSRRKELTIFNTPSIKTNNFRFILWLSALETPSVLSNALISCCHHQLLFAVAFPLVSARPEFLAVLRYFTSVRHLQNRTNLSKNCNNSIYRTLQHQCALEQAVSSATATLVPDTQYLQSAASPVHHQWHIYCPNQRI